MACMNVCIEVTEAITLLLPLLSSEIGHIEVNVTWEIAAAPTELRSQLPDLLKCTVQGRGLRTCSLNATNFLQMLYASAPALQQFMQSQAWPSPLTPLELVWERAGIYPSATCCSVEGLQNSQLSIKETINCLNHLPSSSLSLTVQALVCWEDIEADILKTSHHLHLLHVINPELCLKFQVERTVHGIRTCAEHVPEGFRSLLRTPFKLATSLQHYFQPSQAFPLCQGKLHLVKGQTVLLPCSLEYGFFESGSMQVLHLSCMAALVPRVRSGRKVPADQCCACVNVNLFGPGMVPLLQPGSSLQSSLLANWSQYRLAMEAVGMTSGYSGPQLVPCLQYKVKPPGEVRTGVASREHTLHLFMMFEHTPAPASEDEGREGSESLEERGGDEGKWAHLISTTAALRNNLVSILTIHSAKLHKAVHSSLNKLLCNYASHAELRHRVERAVPTVAEAVNSIVKHSTNQHFKDHCHCLLQLEGETQDGDVGRALARKLSQLAQLKLGLTITSTVTPPSQEVGSGSAISMEQGTLLGSLAAEQREDTSEQGDSRTLHQSQGSASSEDFEALCIADCETSDTQGHLTECDYGDTWETNHGDTWETNHGDTWETNHGDTFDTDHGDTFNTDTQESTFDADTWNAQHSDTWEDSKDCYMKFPTLPSQSASLGPGLGEAEEFQSWPRHVSSHTETPAISSQMVSKHQAMASITTLETQGSSGMVTSGVQTSTRTSQRNFTCNLQETRTPGTLGRPHTMETPCIRLLEATHTVSTTCTLSLASQGEAESASVVDIHSISENDFMWD